jgi:hypothetical protein
MNVSGFEIVNKVNGKDLGVYPDKILTKGAANGTA